MALAGGSALTAGGGCDAGMSDTTAAGSAWDVVDGWLAVTDMLSRELARRAQIASLLRGD